MRAASRTFSRVILAIWVACCASPTHAFADARARTALPPPLAARMVDGAVSAAADTSASADGLKPSTAPAWVPSRPVAAQAPWEVALRAPERLATLPLMSGLRYFGPEVEAHVERGECPAGVCRPIHLTASASTARQPTMAS